MRAALLAVLLLAGCLGERALDAPRPEDADDAAPRETAIPLEALAPVIVGTNLQAAEPSVAVAPDGAIYVVSGLRVWRSDDDARTFTPLGEGCAQPLPVCPEPMQESGLEGPNDASLAIARDGTLHFAGLDVPHIGLRGNSERMGIPYQRSSDRGETWSEPVQLLDGDNVDRQWIAIGPDGAIHVVFRHFIDDRALRVVTSRDDGATWGEPVRVADDGRLGPLVADPATGTLGVPHVAGGALRFARSEDGGRTWTNATVAQLPGSTYIFPIAAFDAAGVAYVAWAEAEPPAQAAVPRVLVATSHDRGANWSAPVVVSTPDRPAVFPWIVAGEQGRVALTWYEGQLSSSGERIPNMWDVKLAVSTDADLPNATYVLSNANTEPVHLGSICTSGNACLTQGGDRSRADFYEMAMLPDGHLALAWTQDGDAPGTVKVVATRTVAGTTLKTP